MGMGSMFLKLMGLMMGNGLKVGLKVSELPSISKAINIKASTEKIFVMAMEKTGTLTDKDTKENSATAIRKAMAYTSITMETDIKEIGKMICAKDKAAKFTRMDLIMWVLGIKIRNMGKENCIVLSEL